MARKITLEVKERQTFGKGENRRLRQQGLVPGIFYAKDENVKVQLEEMPLLKAYQQVGTSTLFNLKIAASKARPVMIKEIVFHPFKRQIQHVDFFGIDMNKSLRVMVPVVLAGEADSPGVSLGGILDLIRDQLEVECLPADIPEAIEIDVSKMQLNESIHISDVKVPAKVTLIFEENFSVLGLALPAAATEEEETEDETTETEDAAQ